MNPQQQPPKKENLLGSAATSETSFVLNRLNVLTQAHHNYLAERNLDAAQTTLDLIYCELYAKMSPDEIQNIERLKYSSNNVVGAFVEEQYRIQNLPLGRRIYAMVDARIAGKAIHGLGTYMKALRMVQERTFALVDKRKIEVL